MNLRTKLSKRIHIDDINEVVIQAQENEDTRKELFGLAFDNEQSISINALWIMTHCTSTMNKCLYAKQNELIDKVISTDNSSQRRLILTILQKQALATPLRIDFLDFCLEQIISQKEALAVRSLCIKLAYEMCKPIPELLQEYKITLDVLDPKLLPPSLRTARKNIMNSINAKNK